MHFFCVTRQNKKSVIFAIFLLFFIFFSPPAHALSNGSIGIVPSGEKGTRDWFIYDLKPGESTEDHVVIINYSEVDQYVTVRAYDSEPSNIGGFALSGPNSEQKGIGLWIKLDEEEATLAPGEKKVIRFTITIPETADAGEHSGAVTVQTAPKELKGRSGISIGTRVGARVYETVPGEILKKISLVSFGMTDWEDRGYFQLDLTVKNEGNVTLTPMARLNISGWGLVKRNKFFHETTLQKGFELMRNTEVSTNWQWERPYFGQYNFQVTMEYEDENNVMQKITTETLSIFIMPLKDAGILGAALLFIILCIIGWIIYRKKKYSGKGWEEYKTKDTDNIMVLAQKHGVSWKHIVKANKIKKPYFLMSGQTILVPPSVDSKGKKTDPKSKKKTKTDIIKWVLLVAITILTTAALVVAIILFVQSMDKEKGEEVEMPVVAQDNIMFGSGSVDPQNPEGLVATSTPEIIATPTPAPTIVSPNAPTTTDPIIETPPDKAKISVSILNGSGITGYAGKIADILKENGYGKITTGNADSFDYSNATIRYLDGFLDVAEDIKKLLGEEYGERIIEQSDKQAGDIVVILGTK